MSFTAEQLQAMDIALTELENHFANLIALNSTERRALAKMGGKSEAFCRQAVAVLGQNPQLVPPCLDVAAAQTNLTSLDQLRPRLLRLQRFTERTHDSEMALGTSVMSVALKGYAQLKLHGKNQGLDSLRQALGSRFARSTAARPEEEAQAA
jgi:hypothetical protein